MYKWFKMSEFDSPDQPGSGELMEPAVVQALDIAREFVWGGQSTASKQGLAEEHLRALKVPIETTAVEDDADGEVY